MLSYKILYRKVRTAHGVLFKDGVICFVCLSLRRIFPLPNPFFFWDRLVLMDGRGVNLPASVRSECEYLIRVATQQDHNDLDLQFPHKKKAHDLGRDEGDDCIVVKVGEKIIAFTWLKYDDCYYLPCGMKIIPRGKYAWGYNFFIVPEYRGVNVFVQLNIFKYETLHQKGYEGITYDVVYTNQRSMRSFVRIGEKIYETVYIVSIFGLKMYFRKGNGRPTLQTRWTYDVHARMALE